MKLYIIMSMWYARFGKHKLGMYVILVCSSTDYLYFLFAVSSAALSPIVPPGGMVHSNIELN